MDIFFTIVLLIFYLNSFSIITYFCYIFLKETISKGTIKNVDKYSNIIISINSIFILFLFSINYFLIDGYKIIDNLILITTGITSITFFISNSIHFYLRTKK